MAYPKMNRIRVVISIIACFVALVGTSAAKTKERNWQTGKVLDTNRDKTYAGSIGDASGTATTAGNTTYGNANGSTQALYRVYETYTIESGDFIYVCEEHLRWRWSKPATLTVNGPVEFAIEKDRLFIKSEDGAEHETKIN